MSDIHNAAVLLMSLPEEDASTILSKLEPKQVEQAVGPDILDTLAQQTGLSRDELLKRLSQVLPHAVDQLTPQGQLPGRDGWSRA